MSAAHNRLVKADLIEHLQELPLPWQQLLGQTHLIEILEGLSQYLRARLAQEAVVYPTLPFNVLKQLAPESVKVVILGQDPYHGPNQAQGLAFSVPDHEKCPPSLRNIFKEIQRDFAGTLSTNDLTRWVAQGVLLLNTVLTVEDGKPASHAKRGWESITDAIIAGVAAEPSPKVFMLWGAHAQSKVALITSQRQHLILKANHPSPLSAMRPPLPFIGCGHFVQTNQWLVAQGLTAIDW